MILIIFGRLIQILIALVMMRVATTLLSPDEMGRVSIALTTISFFALFLVNPVGMFINRRLHAWQISGVAAHYFFIYVIYLLLVCLIAAALLFLFGYSGTFEFGMSIHWLLLLVCGSILFNTINQTSIPSLNLLGDGKKFMLLSTCSMAVSFAIAFTLVMFTSPLAQYWLFGLLIGQSVFALIGTRVLFAKFSENKSFRIAPNISKNHIRKIFNFAWPVSIAAGLAWVQLQSYRYIMDEYFGLAQLGLFVAGYGISAGLISAFESVLTTFFQPRLYREINSGDSDMQTNAWQIYADTVIPSLFLTVALTIVLAPELTKILLGENFQSGAIFVVWGALAEAARVLMGIYSLIAHIHMRTRWLIMPSIVGAILSIGLCLSLMPLMGPTGIALGLVLSGFIVVFILHIFLARKIRGVLPVQSMLMVGVASIALWAVALSLRYILSPKNWLDFLSICILVGVVYLVFQYLFLRTHLKDGG